MRKSIFALKMFVLIASLGVALGGYKFLMGGKSQPIATIQTQESSRVQELDSKNLRKALSDLAWGRNRKEGPAIKPEALVQKTEAQASESSEAQRIALMTMQSRMAYCAQNWQKDATCGRPAKSQ